MVFKGFSRTFSTADNKQYETIGEYWDIMSALYGRENLRGLGYNWTMDTIEYVIGLKSNEFFDMDMMDLEMHWKEISLPDTGWKEYHGITEKLDTLYERIYQDGILTYEIEEFSEDGLCKILITRDRGL